MRAKVSPTAPCIKVQLGHRIEWPRRVQSVPSRPVRRVDQKSPPSRSLGCSAISAHVGRIEVDKVEIKRAKESVAFVDHREGQFSAVGWAISCRSSINRESDAEAELVVVFKQR